MDGNGNPLTWEFSKCASYEGDFVEKVLKEAIKLGLITKRVGADKGYDSYDLRVRIKKLGLIPIIEYKETTKSRVYEKEFKEQKGYCTKRWKVERTFAWIDNSNRRIDQFYEKSIESYSRLYKISVIRHYLKLCRRRLL